MTSPLRNRKAQRGITLLEGMMSTFIMLLGLVGVLNGIMYAARQNSSANKMTRAGAIATQTRSGILAQGLARMNAGGGLFSGCTNDASLASLTDGLSGVSGYDGICTVDIDAFETNAAADKKITPGYQNPDGNFRRVAVRHTQSGVPGGSVAVIVSWTEAGVTRFHRQVAVFYDSSNLGGTEL